MVAGVLDKPHHYESQSRGEGSITIEETEPRCEELQSEDGQMAV